MRAGKRKGRSGAADFYDVPKDEITKGPELKKQRTDIPPTGASPPTRQPHHRDADKRQLQQPPQVPIDVDLLDFDQIDVAPPHDGGLIMHHPSNTMRALTRRVREGTPPDEVRPKPAFGLADTNGKKSRESALLNAASKAQGTLFLTPLVDYWMKSWFGEYKSYIPSERNQRRFPKISTNIPSSFDARRAKHALKFLQFRTIRGKYNLGKIGAAGMSKAGRAYKRGGVEYKIGDYVMFLRNFKDAERLAYNGLDEEDDDEELEKLEPEVGFGKIIAFSSLTRIVDGLISPTVHIHPLLHGRSTWMGSVARPDELFALPDGRNIDGELLLCKVSVLEVEPGDERPVEPSPHDFFLSHIYDTLRFLSLPTQFFGDSRHWDGCYLCRKHRPISASAAARVLSRPAIHPGDFVKIQGDTENGCTLGVVSGVSGQNSYHIGTFARRETIEGLEWPNEYRDPRRLVYIAKTITVDESAIIEKTWIHHDEQNGENLNALDGLYFDEWIPDGKVEAANVKRMTRGQYTRLLVPCEICETEDTRRTFYLNTEAGGCLKATMSLFSGGGGETCAHVMSGHLEHLVAVDISPSAAKTIRANTHELPRASVVNASVNDFLKHVVRGCGKSCQCKGLDGIVYPRNIPDHFDMISFGPPCPQNSSLNHHLHEQKGPRNLTFFAALSAVDLWKPTYVLIENVPRIYENWTLQDRAPNGGLALVVRILMELGYQLHFGLINAEHYGAPQHRRRFFLLATLMTQRMPTWPQPTHYAPKSDEDLEMKFGNKEHGRLSLPARTTALYRTPTVREVTEDLPSFDVPTTDELKDAELRQDNGFYGFQECQYTQTDRTALQRMLRRDQEELKQHYIPVWKIEDMERVANVLHASGSNYKSIVSMSLPRHLVASESATARDNYQKDNYYGRLYRDQSYKTLVTNYHPSAKQGRILHYEQDRPMSIREIARGQTFPDTWVFESETGDVGDMISQIGNAVPVVVSEAFRRSILEARYEDWRAAQ